MSETSKFDPKRRLCPDGSCIGVVGPDGRCGECGRTAGAAPAASADGAGAPAPEREASGEDEPEEVAEAAPAGDFDARRRLCDDGSCVGIVGADGRCNVCGLGAA